MLASRMGAEASFRHRSRRNDSKFAASWAMLWVSSGQHRAPTQKPSSPTVAQRTSDHPSSSTFRSFRRVGAMYSLIENAQLSQHRTDTHFMMCRRPHPGFNTMLISRYVVFTHQAPHATA
jgi:hypothetical protein